MQRHAVSHTACTHACLHCHHVNLVSLGNEPKNNLNLIMHLEGYKSKAALGELVAGSPQKMLCPAPLARWHPWGTCEAGGTGTLFWSQRSYPGG